MFFGFVVCVEGLVWVFFVDDIEFVVDMMLVFSGCDCFDVVVVDVLIVVVDVYVELLFDCIVIEFEFDGIGGFDVFFCVCELLNLLFVILFIWFDFEEMVCEVVVVGVVDVVDK